MNIGFYVDSLNNSKESKEICSFLNTSIEKNKLRDANVFYKNIAYNPEHPKFGLFNDTDIWLFTGNLICCSIQAAKSASKVVNKFKMAFMYDGKEKNILDLIDIAGSMPFITRSKKDHDYIQRVTGKDTTIIEDLNIENLVRATT